MTDYIKKKHPLKLNIQFFAETGTKDKKDEHDLKNLQTEFNKSWTELKGLLDQQADEIRSFGQTNDDTSKQIKSVEGKIENYEKEVKGITDRFQDMETKMNRFSFQTATADQLKTPGELFIESDPYKHMIESKSKTSQAMNLKSFHRKAIDSDPASAGVLTSTTRYPEIISSPDTQLTIRDLLNVAPTGANAIEFIEETGFTNNAAMQVEGALKAESDITFDIRTQSVKTIAHWLPATRQIVSDAPMLQNYVDNRLLYGLRLVEERQVLFGTGTGEDLQGIMTHTGIQDMGDRTLDDTGATKADVPTRLDWIRTTMTEAQVAGYPVTGLILHPRDWEDIELAKGGDGHYLWTNVNNGGETRLWRVPVIQSTEMTEGTFLAGAFGIGAQLWDREEANVRVSEHHSDYFARNMIAVLAEERLAQTIYRPESFITGTFA
jgi:HK97 family phage major capsid protein